MKTPDWNGRYTIITKGTPFKDCYKSRDITLRHYTLEQRLAVRLRKDTQYQGHILSKRLTDILQKYEVKVSPKSPESRCEITTAYEDYVNVTLSLQFDKPSDVPEEDGFTGEIFDEICYAIENFFREAELNPQPLLNPIEMQAVLQYLDCYICEMNEEDRFETSKKILSSNHFKWKERKVKGNEAWEEITVDIQLHDPYDDGYSEDRGGDNWKQAVYPFGLHWTVDLNNHQTTWTLSKEDVKAAMELRQEHLETFEKKMRALASMVGNFGTVWLQECLRKASSNQELVLSEIKA